MSGQNNKTKINIFTIGFAGKSACEFFTKLKDAGVKRVIGVRLNNVSLDIHSYIEWGSNFLCGSLLNRSREGVRLGRSLTAFQLII